MNPEQKLLIEQFRDQLIATNPPLTRDEIQKQIDSKMEQFRVVNAAAGVEKIKEDRGLIDAVRGDTAPGPQEGYEFPDVKIKAKEKEDKRKGFSPMDKGFLQRDFGAEYVELELYQLHPH